MTDHCDRCGKEGVHQEVLHSYNGKDMIWLCYDCWVEWDELWMRTYRRRSVVTFGYKGCSDKLKKRERDPDDLWHDFMSGELKVTVKFD